MMEDDQLALLEGVVSQLLGHVRKQVLEDGPVVELTSAEQMQKEIDFSIPDRCPFPPSSIRALGCAVATVTPVSRQP